MELQRTTDFVINELVLVTKGGKIDLKPLFQELNIFDSIYKDHLSGNVVIEDAVGINENLVLNGTEILLVNIGKTEDEILFKKAFRVYQETDRELINENAESYILHFVSEELIFSEQLGVSQYYTGTYTEIALSILIDYLEVPNTLLTRGFVDKSVGLKKVVIPRLAPLDAVKWCSSRAVDSSKSPSFLFFHNLYGYNFATLSTLLTSEPLFKVNFQRKDLEDNIGVDMFSAKDYGIDSQFNLLKSIKNGVYAGSFTGFDPLTRIISSKNISYADHWQTVKHATDTPDLALIRNRNNDDSTESFGARTSMYYMTTPLKFSEYVKSHDPTMFSSLENTEDYVFQRRAIFYTLATNKMYLALPGRFDTTSGLNLMIEAFKKGEKIDGDPNYDFSLYGKKLITSCRHIIKNNTHDMVLELSTTSKSDELPIPITSEYQKPKEVMNYDES